ncbi:SDR family NAD(P)-dependent oxidoreductase [Actinoplanes regularis]|uniref:Short-chain dehydrogenase n=1 Tax=Actinoplanes regularis TaxID=52697 RepID=A0A238WH95_9ACTN|nr:SDR family NAD(P)-dependent oxidoreductase [Actinoplanes regularis]GIE84890.1 short-chain dehydrogenase [Actinoplanes regularis]GLW27078.1 short-chain dehydrogenase [Actinoplanes regularis]SNR45847.1 Short-chain dehydrogenase [Actinoplanes regularis]
MTQTIVITGGSSGIGLAAARQLAARGDEVVLVGRDPDRLAAAVEQVREAGGGREPRHFQADFEKLDDVRGLADRLLADVPEIDVLANNAGGIISQARETVDGFEATMQANHLAPFLLTHLLRDRLAGGRVVNTASRAHAQGRPGTNFVDDYRSYSSWRSYGASKSANILFTAEAARRWEDVLSVSFHPGVVRTNFGASRLTRLFYRYAPGLVPPEQAGELLTWLCTAPAGELENGAYYVGRTVARPAAHARDPELAAGLWAASAAATGLDERPAG